MPDFELPIEKFLVTKTQEHFPEFDLRQGTAFRDMVIKPNIMFLQPYRDQANILKRNMSLQNYELMIDEEMDALVSNVFVDRRGGLKSTGTARAYFDEAKAVSFTTDAEFRTADGLIFNPVETVTFLPEEVALNIDGLYFFVDVQVEAEAEGEEYNIDEHSLVFVNSAPEGIIKVDNVSSFASGVDIEDNATLKQRTEYSIAVRDLVIKKSIQAVILEAFESVRELVPIGYGDPEMDRDVIPVIMDLLVLLEERTTGEVVSGNTFTDPGVPNWHDLGIKPGHELVVLDSPDTGKHPIESVTSTVITIDGVMTTRTGITYGIDGLVKDDAYHIGGKVDIYLDSTGLTTSTVVLAPAQEINEVSETALPYYEGGIAFTLPLVGINQIIEIDPSTREQIGDALIEGSDYVINVADPLYRYSTKEVVTIQLLETDPGAPLYFIGSTLQVDYFSDSVVNDVQEFADNELNRVITADILVRRCVPSFVDITLEYRGDIDEAELVAVVSDFVDKVNIGQPLAASDIVSVVYYFNVNFVVLSFNMSAETHNVDGTITTTVSTSEIDVDRTVKFVPRTIDVTKVT